MTLFPDWREIEIACSEIAHAILKDRKKIDYVYGIRRGGLIPAVILSHLLNKPMEYSDTEVCLIVDDICDSGLTLRTHKDDNEKCITVSIYRHEESKFTPDYYYETCSEWILFPWETKETSKVDYKNQKHFNLK